MSIQAMAWAMAQQAVTNASERHVLLCLANYADENGRGAFPSVSRLVRDTGLSERTIQYKLASLEQQGILSSGNRAVVAAYITRPDHRPSVYDINMERGATTAPGIERGATDNTTGCKPQHHGVQLTTERGAPVAPDTSLEPSIEPSIEQTPLSAAKKTPPTPHQSIVDAYNEILGNTLTPVKPALWPGSARATALQARWKENPSRHSLEWWEGWFRFITKSPFLMGDNDKNWKPDLGWLLKKENFIKVCEGKYHA